MSSESGPPTPPAVQPDDTAERGGAAALVEDPTVREHPRYAQMFPVLSDAEIERVRRFGSLSRYTTGTLLYRAGSPCPGMFLLLAGKVRIVGRDGLGHERILH